MIDIKNETLITLPIAARQLPPQRRGRPVNVSTIFRWITDGVRSATGETIRLEACRIGGRWLTSMEALARFADRQTPRFDDGQAPVPRSPGKRQQASERAAKQLAAAGI